MNNALSAALKSTPLHVAFAFLAMGGWAIYANAAHPMPGPLPAGLVQGSISAGLTLFLKRTVDWLRPTFSQGIGHVAPALIASSASAILLIIAHMLAGTPEIAKTIAVPLLVSASYILTYNFMSQRRAREEQHE
ncbi:hypothetical protein [Sedimentitalea todarodis]|uniref:Transmembrane protein n=1 Tax=Sedimentitalea todarodis TaxID=1631240 RepID=A0ABU3VE32_9RHOB|nr:hypothetical protein [Sedimentitalea todarodis]MDU9004444.1 hypothetical protein [Sedimentitalea todarodis]